MRHLVLIALACLLAVGAWAQEDDSQGIIDAWHLSTSGTMDPMGATFWVDFSQTVAATITANTGQTLTRHGAPVRVSDGTWPAGLSGAQGFAEKFDGAADYWTSTIAPPAGDFSAVCAFTPANTSGLKGIISAHDTNSGNFGG